MERTIAIKKLGKLLGKKLGYRIDNKAPTQEERDAAKEEWAIAAHKQTEITKWLTARRDAILTADPEYQSLLVQSKDARALTDRLSSIRHRHKITVGISESLFFLVKATGDSWEEVISKLEEKVHA